MKQNYNFDLSKIKSLSSEEKNIRKENLTLFLESGFPNKRNEDWKFTDLNSILNKNFDKITNDYEFDINKKIKLVEDFDHNYILLTNGILSSSNFQYEEENNNKITNFQGEDTSTKDTSNTLTLLNNALSTGGYYLEISKNYKFKKPLIIYNYFSKNINGVIFNNTNQIRLNSGAELLSVEYTIDTSQDNFIRNTLDNVFLENDSVYKHICIQNSKSNGHFYRQIKSIKIIN